LKCIIAKGRYEDYAGDAVIAMVYEDGAMPAGAVAGIAKTVRVSGHFRVPREKSFRFIPVMTSNPKRLILIRPREKG